MDQIIHYRQMMAEQKFSELQRIVEAQLMIEKESRYELLSIYVDALKAQDKVIPPNILLELAEHYSDQQDFHNAITLIGEIDPRVAEKFYIRVAKLKIKAAVSKGQMGELYTLIANFFLKQFEKQMPFIPTWLSEIAHTYFQNDFHLQLKELALLLLTNDLKHAEELTKTLIVSCIEKSSPKGIANKLSLIGEVLKSGSTKSHLEIYLNFCLLAVKGEFEKSDLKKIVEMIIGFDDFKFQVLVLDLLDKHKLTEEAGMYSEAIKLHSEYDYVYFDKYFPKLKSYFFKFTKAPEKNTETEQPAPDLKLSKLPKEVASEIRIDPVEIDENEKDYLNFLKYQNFSAEQLCDLAVSFLQSEMPRIALKASEMVIELSQDDKTFLKGSYLKLTALLYLQDFRAALDTCLLALSKATTKDDVLSFLYGQAEIHIRLNEKKQAKRILNQILLIDGKYRSAKERLEKL